MKKIIFITAHIFLSLYIYAKPAEYLISNNTCEFINNEIHDLSPFSLDVNTYDYIGSYVRNYRNRYILGDHHPVGSNIVYDTTSKKFYEINDNVNIIGESYLCRKTMEDDKLTIELIQMNDGKIEVLDTIVVKKTKTHILENILFISENKNTYTIYNIKDAKWNKNFSIIMPDGVSLADCDLINEKYLVYTGNGWYNDDKYKSMIFSIDMSNEENKWNSKILNNEEDLCSFYCIEKDKMLISLGDFFLLDLITYEMTKIEQPDLDLSQLFLRGLRNEPFFCDYYDQELYKFNFTTKKFEFIIKIEKEENREQDFGLWEQIVQVQEKNNMVFISTFNYAYIYDMTKKEVTTKFSLSNRPGYSWIGFRLIGDRIFLQHGRIHCQEIE
ncbi:MAG: hypothetical protein JXR63_03020 [Spirochaetales bacterium]|nr:hypothetical protein [Spirochaetales bacterium]